MTDETDKAEIKQDNLKIWSAVEKTDPDSTKKVTFGRTFTAIDAHSQIKAATEQFGPIGQGWGYNTDYGFQTIGDDVLVWCDLVLWWAKPGEWEGIKTPGYNSQYGPVRGMAQVTAWTAGRKDRKAPDNDAAKKAMTDALTKALSHLGFNADVFLGKFDDNKYVQQRQSDVDKENTAEQAKYLEKRKAFINAITKAKTAEKADTILDEYREWVSTLEPAVASELKMWVDKKKKELTEPMP